MSYSLDIGDNEFNYTWNLGQFFRDFIKNGEREGLEALDGLTGKEAAYILNSALHHISVVSRRRENGVPTWKYFGDKYDPSNYWGDVMSAVLFMTELYSTSIDNPRKKWRYST